jgi:AcrR family transcriptional regulator
MAEKAAAMPDSGQRGGNVRERTGDRRVARTSQALLQAFIALVQEKSYASIRVADIVERADVGRSTFYDHFGGKDAMLLASMGWIFAILAGAADPATPRDRVESLVHHFWGNRRLARAVMAPPIERKLRRALTDAIADVLGGDPASRRLDAVRIAAGQLGLLDAWTRGEVTAEQGQIADALIAIART